MIASGLAAALAAGLSETSMVDWGWRVPFAFGAVLSLVGFWIRTGAHETLIKDTGGKRPRLFEAFIS